MSTAMGARSVRVYGSVVGIILVMGILGGRASQRSCSMLEKDPVPAGNEMNIQSAVAGPHEADRLAGVIEYYICVLNGGDDCEEHLHRSDDQQTILESVRIAPVHLAQTSSPSSPDSSG